MSRLNCRRVASTLPPCPHIRLTQHDYGPADPSARSVDIDFDLARSGGARRLRNQVLLSLLLLPSASQWQVRHQPPLLTRTRVVPGSPTPAVPATQERRRRWSTTCWPRRSSRGTRRDRTLATAAANPVVRQGGGLEVRPIHSGGVAAPSGLTRTAEPQLPAQVHTLQALPVTRRPPASPEQPAGPPRRAGLRSATRRVVRRRPGCAPARGRSPGPGRNRRHRGHGRRRGG